MLKRIMVLAVAGLLSINVSANDAVKAQVDSAKEGVKKEAAAKVEAVTAPKAATPAPAAPAEKIDINKADAKTLEKTLDGIGAKKAEAIVKYRTDKGPFTKVEDLLKVDGVGEAAVKKNIDKLTVGEVAKAAAPATTTTPAPAAKPATTPAVPAKPAEAAHK